MTPCAGDPEINDLTRRISDAVEAIGVPIEPPFHRSKGIGDPLEPWGDAVRSFIDHRGLTGNRVKLAWFVFDKFDRNQGCFSYGLEEKPRTSNSRSPRYTCSAA